MLIKWLGGGLLVALAGCYCIGNARRWQAMARLLDAWILLLRFARGQISCFGLPLSSIMARAPFKVKAVLGRYMTDGRGDVISLCRSTAELLPDVSAELLDDLADEIGTIWRQEQLERLDYYIVALENERIALAAALPARIKLHGTMSLCGAMALILLLW